MSLITKDHLSLTLKTIEKLLSFKADKAEVDAKLTTKIDRSEIEETDAIELAAKTGLITPTAAEDGSIYTDENGAMYSL
jgi:hypothetical protein